MVGTLIRRPLGFVSDAWRAILAQTTPSGTYLPTLTNTTNVDATTAFTIPYLRVGDRVIVAGGVTVDATASSALTVVGLSLPVASDIGSAEDCQGVIHAAALTQGGVVTGDIANNRATLTFPAVSTANTGMNFIFMYRVI